MTSIRLSLGGDDNQEKEKDANAQLMELDKGKYGLKGVYEGLSLCLCLKPQISLRVIPV